DIGADARDDAAAHLGRLVRRHDQTARKLRLIELFDDEVVVQRLECRVGKRLPFQHAFTILRACASVATTSRSRTPISRSFLRAGSQSSIWSRTTSVSRSSHCPTCAAAPSI